jgi:hypothetical protein
VGATNLDYFPAFCENAQWLIDQFAPLSKKIQTTIAKITSQPSYETPPLNC